MAPPQRTKSTPYERRTSNGISRRSLLAGAAAFGAFGSLAAACSRIPPEGSVEGGDLLERLRSRGSVKVGIASEPPFGYINKDGEPDGEAPAIAKVIFTRLGIDNVTPVPVEFGALIPGLKAQQFDVVSAGMYINPTRCAQVLFSDPDYLMLDSFIVPAGNPHNIQRYEDIAEQNLVLATGTAYAEIDYALAAGIPDSRLLILPDQVAGLDAVVQGRAAAFAGTNVTVTGVVENSPRAEATEPFQPYVNGEPAYGAGGFAFRRSEKNFRDAFNVELHKLKDSGELLDIVSPFGFTEAEMTDLTAEELC
ncbi:ectoine/hydroxyectoine ABC transporter substrate-binding protein EhuB [Streptomyces sp. JH002]|uniref:ectoine/hydroxyectoine ABC transporter substrate-binding protein EhuB n=1 Tax=Streptomyces TaxID=1883 RepID=UPI0004C69FFF|nr:MULTISPECIES: ectoine/hydroxyectoine ABC transporter substrate-binding protein EhuB [unclassified Streptomyces]MCU4746659.1 ectoine/hydroxyectoine ABC transporter substrate-binding protein EhuB [Streptomyces sp. G-5]QQN77385.1 ectoine/hydroxyectoine ABC transporter substrate-binding protein EhuB [Streptomyces sp. XC 2026]